MNQHCDSGRCVPNCSCTGCGAGLTCNRTTGRCESPGCDSLPCAEALRDCRGEEPRCLSNFCDGVTCPIGQVCSNEMRACIIDSCQGISCPSGQECRGGSCVARARPEPTATDGGSGGPDASTAMDGGGTGMDASANGDASRGDSAIIDPGMMNGGCGCRAIDSTHSKSNPLALAALAALASTVVTRRRRR